MDITTKYTLDMLTQDSVSVLKQQYIFIGGAETQVGGNIRNAYMNSPKQRTQLQTDLPPEQYNAVMAVWGDTPTVEDPANPESEV